MKFYFAGAIRGGRERIDTFIKMNELLEQYGEVLDKHVANPNVNEMEADFSLEERYLRDLKWIQECDLFVAEVSTPSLGVGYEIAYAESLGKRILCFYDSNISISAMIGGNRKLEVSSYQNVDDLLIQLKEKLMK